MSNLTDIKSQALKDLEIAEKATEGPWTAGHPFYSEDGIISVRDSGEENLFGDCCIGMDTVEENVSIANFIAHSRLALPASARNVLKLVEALEVAREALMAQVVFCQYGNFNVNPDFLKAALAEIERILNG